MSTNHAVGEPLPGRADQRRNDERIMRAASRLLADNPEASMQAIADAAGVTRLTVYRRFPNREAMKDGMRAAATAEAQAVLADVEAREDADVFDHLVIGLLRLVRHHPLAMRRHRPTNPDDVNPVDQRFAAVVARAQAAGVVRSDVPPAVVSAMLFGTLTALREGLSGLDDAEAARKVSRLLLDGLGRSR